MRSKILDVKYMRKNIILNQNNMLLLNLKSAHVLHAQWITGARNKCADGNYMHIIHEKLLLNANIGI